MKRVDAIIRPSQLNFVREALDGLGYGGITAPQGKSHGKQRGVTEQGRGRRQTRREPFQRLGPPRSGSSSS